MSRTANSCVSLVLVIACLGLLAAGCGKKRIYTEPYPPGSTPERVQRTSGASSGTPSGAKAATTAKSESQETVQTPAKEPAVQDAEAKAEDTKPVELGTALADEPDLLTGTAGVMDDELIGFPLADGSSYDPDALVAGHRTLPLGSRVEVTDTTSGRKVLVNIADRGPFEKERVVNLSRRAASDLGMDKTAQVSLKLIGATVAPAKAASQAPLQQSSAKGELLADQKKTTPGAGSFYVQVGAFIDQDNAQIVQDKLTLRGLSGVRLVDQGSGSLVRVQAGPYANREAAQKVLDELRAEYPAAFIITPD